MQAYDLIMLIVLGMATIFGAIKGFAWQVASLTSIITSYLVAYRFRFQVAEMIHAAPPWNLFLAMLILFVGTSFVIWVGFRLLSGAIDKVRLKEFDRHMGAAFGLAKGLIYCLLITMFAMSLLGPKQQSAICQSRSGYYIAATLDKGVGILPKEIHDVVGPYLVRLDEKLKGGQNGFPADFGSDSMLGGNLSSLPGMTRTPEGQGGSTGWDLGGLIQNVFPGQITEPPSVGRGGIQVPTLPDNFQQSFAPDRNSGNQNLNFPPPGNFAPPIGIGFSGSYDGFGTQSQSAQQPGYVLPR